MSKARWWLQKVSDREHVSFVWNAKDSRFIKSLHPRLKSDEELAIKQAGEWDPSISEWTLQDGLRASTREETVPYLTSVEKLCYNLIVNAVFDFVAGDEQAAWWLFEDHEWTAAIPFAMACEVLELDQEKLRAGIRRAAEQVKDLGRVEARKALLEMVRQREE